MAKVKVAVIGTVGRVVFIDPDATRGARLGTDLFTPDGEVGTPASVRAWLGVSTGAAETPAGGTNHHRLLQGLRLGDDHPQYTQWVQDEVITGAWTFQNTVTVNISGEIQWRAEADQVEQTVPYFLVRTDEILSQTPWAFLTFRDDSSANAVPVRFAHDDFGSLHIVTNADYAGSGNLFTRDDTSQPAFMISLNQEFDAIAFHVAPAGVGNINWNAAGAALLITTSGQVRVVSAGTAALPALTVGGLTNLGIWTSSNIIRFSTSGTERLNAGSAGIDAGPPFRADNGTAGAPAFTFWRDSDTNTGMYRVAADQLGFSTGGTLRLTISTAALVATLVHSAPLGAVGAPSYSFTGDLNTGMYSPGADQIGLSTNGVLRLTVANARLTATVPIRLQGYTVATLPAGTVGDTAYVTDANAPTFGAAVAGGGAVTTPVFFDGTNWIVG